MGGTYTDNVPCPECGGARLRPEYLAVTLLGYDFYQLSQMSLSQLADILSRLELPGSRSAARRSLEKLLERVAFPAPGRAGLPAPEPEAGTLSAGEAQRVRLASLLGSGLTA